ncbi:DegT/DnrJ/EryC1/StrS family aminotransferase [Solicola sp. PLA-1-18]|uniref:DegT/DnrJ/EryC1/StrS family aminotransferase n=1 Tax=Solicola sp. PLA-1-18 TaxID=3380532 RepID=UPI003BA2D603
MLPYGRQDVDESDVAAVVDVLRGDWLTTGPSVAAFEQALSERTGGHRVSTCTSGTAALHIAYAAMGVGPGDEVVTTPMTFVATASTAAMLGATIVFADVDPETGLIDPAEVDRLVTERTKVVAAVDYAGQPCDYAALQASADRVGALTLDDAAHSVSGTRDGRPVGDLADVTTLSFFPTKNLTTAEGGAVVAKDDAVATRAARFRTIGLVRERDELRMPDEGPWHQEVHEFGLNYRLSDVHAALGLSQLTRLDAFRARRTEITARYNEAFAGVDGLATPAQDPATDPCWHLYPVRVLGGRRREVFEAMREAGIGVQVNYIPVYWHPAFEDLGYARGLCPRAEEYYSQEISLPLFAAMGDDDVERVIETLTGIVGS